MPRVPFFSLSLSLLMHRLFLFNVFRVIDTRQFVKLMERGDLQSSLGMGMGEYSFNNTFLTDNNNLTPLPHSDFAPFQHNHHFTHNPYPYPPPSQIASSSFNHPTQLFDFFSIPQQHQLADSCYSSSSSKRPRLDSQIQTLLSTNNVVVSPAPVLKHSTRRAAQKLSDKTRSLQKLLPSDKKMDIATMLEEAYKYVRFLQAQVRAIESMPLDSSFVVQNDCDWPCFGGGSGLGMLNRQQLLQVLVNSPRAQTTLYSQGFCVYSLEQLIFMNKLSQPKLFIKN
ncbi:hypothetical protein Dsin_031587 [Dipteronia sinensis]|uniref:BHLH domain-containing protein n=1 Tax=Dipteronia sinensis TaxID=43782 RepID=A0AAD9ZLN3_9ROSI|nr:hypothetical protein Dsin_031587 [Dipteronia sinensis]